MLNPSVSHDHVTGKSQAAVVISLFGNFTVQVNGAVVTNFYSDKTRALLVYLLLARPQPLLRSDLSALLWAGYALPSARANLRQTLAILRDRLAPAELLQGDRTYLQLRLDPAQIWCDVHHFEALLDACQAHDHPALAHCPLCRPKLQEAVQLYQAPLLASFATLDSAPFDQWLQAQRERLAARFAAAQDALTATVKAVGNLPPPLTPLVGRAQPLAYLASQLHHPRLRCLTLEGPGGIGKTRLAIALGAQRQAQFPNGVWLVALSGLAPTTPAEPLPQLQDRLAMAIAAALGLAFYGTTPPAEQVLRHLADKTALLILDSMEHLAAGAAWLPTLLAAAPHLRLLLTTRQRLPLADQLSYPVAGLDVPPVTADEARSGDQRLTHYASVQLFVERATSAGMNIAWERTTLAAVGQLCRFVEGSPWAIEVAVAMLDQQTPAAVLAAIQHNYRSLATPWLDVPLRQRSAEAVFLTTWRLLSPSEAQTLARCAVFRGGFTLDAAQTVAGATPAILEALVQKSLLRIGDAERYTMHDLVRQFAGEQLAVAAAAAEQTHAAHAAYFTALLATWQPTDAVIHPFRKAVAQDWENVQAAWHWALEAGAVALLQQGVSGLAEFGEMMSFYLETERLLAAALARVRGLLAANQATAPAVRDEGIALATLLAHLLWRRSHLLTSALGQLEEAHTLAKELLHWGEQLADDTLIAWGYGESSLVALYQGDYQRQQALLLQALPHAQARDDRSAQVFFLMMLGIAREEQHDYVAAQHDFETALTLVHPLHYSSLELRVLQNLGSSHWAAGNFAKAQHYLQEVLTRAQEVDQKDSITFATACLGALAYTLGDYANARARLERAQQAYLALGDQVLAAQMLNMLAALFIELGDLAAAGEYGQRALALPSAQIYPVQREGLIMQGHLHQAARDWSAARAAYEAAYTLSQQSNKLTDQLSVQAHLANLALAQGDATTALITIEPLVANFAATTFTPAQRPQELLWIAYQILVANDDARAPTVLPQAWALVQEQLAKIDDPRLRETFLTNVPVNRTLGRLIGQGQKGRRKQERRETRQGNVVR